MDTQVIMNVKYFLWIHIIIRLSMSPVSWRNHKFAMMSHVVIIY